MSSRRRLTLVIHSLGQGGAERVVAIMANHWAALGDAVTLITLESTDADTYRLEPSIERVGLGLMQVSRNPLQALRNNVHRIRAVGKAIRASRPDKVISFCEKMNVVTLLACRRSNLGVIIVEQVDPQYHKVGRVWSSLRRFTYPRCESLVVLTDNVRVYCRKLVGRRPIYTVANPACIPASGTGHSADDTKPEGTYRLVAMGRLNPQKGFDLLLESFATLAGKHPDWRLDILGEGDDRPLLENLIDQHGLGDVVGLTGWVANPASILANSDLFVLSSRYEGFGNVVAEALACGLPVVSFDCPSGPGEIVRDGVDGILVPPEDTAALADALHRLMADPSLRAEMALRAPEVVDRYSVERFFEQWDKVFDGEGDEVADGMLSG